MTPQQPGRARWLGRRNLFHLGRFGISAYTVALYIGFVSGVVVAVVVLGLDPLRFADAALVLLAAALIGGRLWYVVQHRRLFTSQPSEILRIKDGGAGLYGGLLLAFIVSLPVVALFRIGFWQFWDGAAVVLLVGMTVTRFGCLMNGCCSGRETDGRLGMWLPDHRGVWLRRYPVQLLEAGLSAVILTVVLFFHRCAPFPGAVFLGSALAYSLGRAGLEFLREEAVTSPASSRMNVIFSAMLAFVCAGGLFVLYAMSQNDLM